MRNAKAAMSSVDRPRRAMRFRARSFMAFALAPEGQIADWLLELDNWIRNSAGFFVGRPVVLDLGGVELEREAITQLVAELQQRDIRIMGIEGADAALLEPGLPPLLKGGRPASDDVFDTPPSTRKLPFVPLPEPQPTALLLNEPVRSGQSIEFPHGDVTVIGSISSGAEVVAGGSIHVYGAIRGRAMAGCDGNGRARIFCNRAEPELLAIDGYFLTAEHIDASLYGRPIQVWLEGTAIKIEAQR
jgi:septum site-determining protein MinC